MGLDSRTVVEKQVEVLMSQYDHPAIKDMPADLHFERTRAIYGEILEGPPVDEQFLNQGALIAVLFYKLAQARGFIADEKSDEKVQVGDNIYAQTPEQAEAVNHFIETGETLPGAGQAYL